MINFLTPYLLFIGMGLYLVDFLFFLWLFIRTLGKEDGAGLTFLQILTSSISLGSLVIFIIRLLSEYGELDLLTARAFAVVNPILIFAVGLWLNYFIHQKKNK